MSFFLQAPRSKGVLQNGAMKGEEWQCECVSVGTFGASGELLRRYQKEGTSRAYLSDGGYSLLGARPTSCKKVFLF